MEIVNNPNINFDWNLNSAWTKDGWVRGISGQYGRTNHNFEGYCNSTTCLTCMDKKSQDPNYQKLVEKVPIPISLLFFIKVTNKQDYELVKEFLNEFDESDHNTKVNIPDITNKRDNNKIKLEYQELCKQIDELNEQINNTNKELSIKVEELYIKQQQEYNQKYNALVKSKKITDTDIICCSECCNLYVRHYKYPKYVYESYDDYDVAFDVCSREGSKFYDEFLMQYNVIEKNWPSNIDREIVTYIEKSTLEQL